MLEVGEVDDGGRGRDEPDVRSRGDCGPEQRAGVVVEMVRPTVARVVRERIPAVEPAVCGRERQLREPAASRDDLETRRGRVVNAVADVDGVRRFAQRELDELARLETNGLPSGSLRGERAEGAARP